MAQFQPGILDMESWVSVNLPAGGLLSRKKTMIKLLSLSFAHITLILMSSLSLGQEPHPCLEVASKRGRDDCGPGKDDFEVRVKNNCLVAMDVQICMKTEKGKWSCGILKLKPERKGSFSSTAVRLRLAKNRGLALCHKAYVRIGDAGDSI